MITDGTTPITAKATDLADRLAALSPAKRHLLALRLRDQREKATASQSAALVAFVASNADPAAPVAEGVRQHLRERLPHYMIPAQIVVLGSIPHTPNGKVDRAALQRLLTAMPATMPTTSEAAQADAVGDEGDEIVQTLKAIWADLLRVERIGSDDDFFALGGHSLLAVRMLARAKAAFGQEIPVALIIEAPTVGKLAEHLRRKAQVQASDPATPQRNTIVALQTQGQRPPLILLPLHMHGVLHYRHLKERLGTERPLFGFDGFDVLAPDAAELTVATLARDYCDQLLRVQPKGPYYLSGISVAGLLAYEMARQLREQGVTDVEPILFDTWGPGYPVRLPTTIALGNFLSRFASPANNPISPLQHGLDLGMNFLEKRYAALKSARAAMRRRASTDVTHGAAFVPNEDPNLHLKNVDVALAKMTATYLADVRPYEGSLSLFRADLQPWNAHDDNSLGWQRVVTGECWVGHVRGDHLGILRRRHVGYLTALLHQRLMALDQKYRVGSYPSTSTP